MASTLSLHECFSTISDPRHKSGQRHPLVAILSLTVVAFLAGMKSLEAIAQFGREYGGTLAKALGFTRRRTPCKATLSNLFAALDTETFEAALGRWLADRARTAGWEAVAVDGKTLRGTASHELPGVHLLSAYAAAASAVLGQLRVDGKTNEHKAALELLGVLPLKGKVVTGDAMFTHADVCETIRAGDGHYVLPVKDNQPRLRAAIETAYREASAFSPLAARGVAGIV